MGGAGALKGSTYQKAPLRGSMPPKQPKSTAAQAHQSNSVRAKSKKDQDSNRKTVFRPVLDNPLTVTWPPLPAHIRQQLLEALLVFLGDAIAPQEQSIQQWRLGHNALKRKGRVSEEERMQDRDGPDTRLARRSADGQEQTNEHKQKRQRSFGPSQADVGDVEHDFDSIEADQAKSSTPITDTDTLNRTNRSQSSRIRPRVLDHLVVGINDVTRALESRIRWARWSLGDASAAPGGRLPLSVSHDAQEKARADASLQKKRNRRAHRRSGKTPQGPSAIPPTPLLRPTTQTILAHHAYDFLRNSAAASLTTQTKSSPPWLLRPRTATEPARLLSNTHVLKTPQRSSPDPAASTLIPTAYEDPAASSAQLESEFDLDAATIARASSEHFQMPSSAATQSPLADAETVPLVDLVFICKPDINPPSLVAHLPTMVAAANGVREALTLKAEQATKAQDPIHTQGCDPMQTDGSAANSVESAFNREVILVPLDIGAERRLADALALRRVTSLAITSTAPGIEPLLELIDKHVKPLRAPWLVPYLGTGNLSTEPIQATYVPTHIKHLRSSAPLNPRAANQAKKEARRQVKESAKQGVYIAKED